MRYGQHYYDDRMQAGRHVLAKPTNNDEQKLVLSVKQNGIAEAFDATTEKRAKQVPTPPSAPPDETLKDHCIDPDSQTDPMTEGHITDTTATKEAKEPARDPLRWFGILIPPVLKQSQQSFSSAVDGPVCAAVNSSRSMRDVEVEIRKLRKEIRRAGRSGKAEILQDTAP